MTPNQRKLTIAALLVAILACLALLPWTDWLHARASAPTEAALRSRIATYIDLRKAHDWIKLYELSYPEHRKAISLSQFLQRYDSGLMKVHDMSLRGVQLDSKTGKAVATINLKAELIIAKLPPQARGVDPSKAVSEGEFTVEWGWRDSDWYFAMDRVVLTGRDSQGKEAKPITPESAPDKDPKK